MSISAINSNLNFTGKYQVNANQEMSSQDNCLKRDALMGFWATKSKDGDKIQQQLKDFYTGPYNENKTAPLNITFEIADSEDKDFEESMKIVGQKFDKIV